MPFDQLNAVIERVFDQRRGLLVRTNDPAPAGHPLANVFRHLLALFLSGVGKTPCDDTLGSRSLIGVACPTVLKYPLVAPFVTELFDQLREKTKCPVIGVNGWLGHASLHRLDNRRRVLHSLIFRRHDERNYRQLRVLLVLGHRIRVALNPLVRDSLVAKVRTNLYRIRRDPPAENPVLV